MYKVSSDTQGFQKAEHPVWFNKSDAGINQYFKVEIKQAIFQTKLSAENHNILRKIYENQSKDKKVNKNHEKQLVENIF